MQVLIIPAWLRRKLDANNLPLTVVLDIKRLSSILTKEDLFFVLKANHDNTEAGNQLPFTTMRMDFPYDNLIEGLLHCFGPNELEMLDAEFNLEKNGTARGLLVYGDVLNQDSLDNGNIKLHNYDTTVIAPEVIAVTVKPTNEDYNVESLQNFLDVVQQQIGFEKVTMLKTFKQFIKKV